MCSYEVKNISSKLSITIEAELLLHNVKAYQPVLILTWASNPKVNILQYKKTFESQTHLDAVET